MGEYTYIKRRCTQRKEIGLQKRNMTQVMDLLKLHALMLMLMTTGMRVSHDLTIHYVRMCTTCYVAIIPQKSE